jgi:hypothetical protein
MSVDESCWKLGEYERHFNIIQAGIRGLASVWLLASFGAIATLLKRDEVTNLWIPADLVIASICAMGAAGLFLLWIIDQLVYHRLLNALFIVGLKLEYDEPERPPIHASMYASGPKLGFARLLSLFYLLPIGALGAICIAACAHALHGDHQGRDWGLIVLAAVPVCMAAATSCPAGANESSSSNRRLNSTTTASRISSATSGGSERSTRSCLVPGRRLPRTLHPPCLPKLSPSRCKTPCVPGDGQRDLSREPVIAATCRGTGVPVHHAGGLGGRVAARLSGQFTGQGGFDSLGLVEHVSGTIDGSHITVHGVYDTYYTPYSWDYSGPLSGGLTSDTLDRRLPVTFTLTTSNYKNHGDYVSSVGGGSDAAHSCIGMPVK